MFFSSCCRNRLYWWCPISYRTLCSSCSSRAPRTSGFRIPPTPLWIVVWLSSTLASFLIHSAHCLALIPPLHLSSLSEQLLRLANRLFAHSCLPSADGKWIQWNWNCNRLKRATEKWNTHTHTLDCCFALITIWAVLYCLNGWQGSSLGWISSIFIAAADCSFAPNWQSDASQLELLPSRDCMICSNRFTHTKYM